MCTAMTAGCFFGRTLDVERCYGEQGVILPAGAPLAFRRTGKLEKHYALAGMAHVQEGCPLYYDGLNEKGLAMAGLNFPGHARYGVASERYGIAPFELIPWVLGQCASVGEAAELLADTWLTDESFAPALPLTPMHWMISDGAQSLVVEPMEQGLMLHPDPAGVLTNSPPFPQQLERLKEFAALSPEEGGCRGSEAVGLPGDWTSVSRFVRAAFVARYGSHQSPEQFFRLMEAVAIPPGCVRTAEGPDMVTVYTSCCDLERGQYHWIGRSGHGMRTLDLRTVSPETKMPVAVPFE